MIIDFHLHIPKKWVTEGVSPRDAAERLMDFLDENGIDVGVILPIAPYVPNDYVHRVVSYEPERLVGFASVVPNPADVAIRELRRAIMDLGLRGAQASSGYAGVLCKTSACREGPTGCWGARGSGRDPCDEG